eukprot:Amastigsp_a841397_9.p3 type:complete len:123 gc:universal Amastigsp_a841397_9:861-1229(+)
MSRTPEIETTTALPESSARVGPATVMSTAIVLPLHTTPASRPYSTPSRSSESWNTNGWMQNSSSVKVNATVSPGKYEPSAGSGSPKSDGPRRSMRPGITGVVEKSNSPPTGDGSHLTMARSS